MRLTPILSVALFAFRVEAQVVYSSPPSPTQCAAAINYVLEQRLPVWDSPGSRAWETVHACPSSGRSTLLIALTLPRVLTEPDFARVKVLFEIFDGLCDGTLFATYATLSLNPSASDGVHMGAMWALTGTLQDFGEDGIYGALGPCGSNGRSGLYRKFNLAAIPSSMPSDALDRAIATVRGIITQGGSAAVVAAARCWKDFLERHAPVDPRKITLAYVCGTTFRLHNGNYAGVALRYAAGKDEGEFTMSGGEDYSLVVDEDEKGVLQVFFADTHGLYPGTEVGKLVATRANGGTVCP